MNHRSSINNYSYTQHGGIRDDVMGDHLNLIRGSIKRYITHYGDLLVNLYAKVKVGGALDTTKQEREAIYRLADRYQQMGGREDKPMSEKRFTELVRSIPKLHTVELPVQTGGSGYREPSRRVSVLYYDYLSDFMITYNNL